MSKPEINLSKNKIFRLVRQAAFVKTHKTASILPKILLYEDIWRQTIDFHDFKKLRRG